MGSSSRSTSAWRRGCGVRPIFQSPPRWRPRAFTRKASPALTDPQVDQPSIGIGVLLVVADADELVVQEGRRAVEQVGGVELEPGPRQGAGCVATEFVEKLCIASGPRGDRRVR